MNYPKYDLSTSTSSDLYEFISKGDNGNIEKLIQFSQTNSPHFTNLAFGDKKHKNDGTFYIDDHSESNNGDRDKVLATVAMSVYEYTATYSDKHIVFSGSNNVRTRLYRMAITKNYEELCRDYDIFGIIASETPPIMVPFDSKINFDAFAVKRKSSLNLKNIVL